MQPVEFEPTISAGERPRTYALDRATTGTGRRYLETNKRMTLVEISNLIRCKWI